MLKKLIWIIAMLSLIPLILAAQEDKTSHILGNATHLIHFDVVANPVQDNSTRLLNGSRIGTPILTTTTKQVGEGSIETDGTASIESVNFNFNNYSNIYNLTVAGWFNVSNV